MTTTTKHMDLILSQQYIIPIAIPIAIMFDIFNHISLPIFLISLSIGLFYVYISVPKPKIIYVYPTPDNIRNFQFKDNADNCFSFKAKEVDCSKAKGVVKKIPVQ